MMTGSVMAGSADSGAIVWTPVPGMLKAIVSSAPTLAFASTIACRSDPAPLSFVVVTVKIVGALLTVVVIDTALFAICGSPSAAFTRAVVVDVPAGSRTCSVTLVVEPPATVPSTHVTNVPDMPQVCAPENDCRTVPGANAVVTTTLVAGFGPLFVAPIVNDTVAPAGAGSGSSDSAIDKSAMDALAGTRPLVMPNGKLFVGMAAVIVLVTVSMSRTCDALFATTYARLLVIISTV